MFLLVENERSLRRRIGGRPGVLSRAVLYGVAALACFATVIPASRAAWADHLRRNPTGGNLAEAIRLDPSEAGAYSQQADLLERTGRMEEAEQAWRRALQRNPRDAEASIRTSLLAEQRGSIGESEQCLLEAARVDKMWLPRWALVNFYARQGRLQDVYKWSRFALERASDDVGALFPILQEAGATPRFILRLLPRNRSITTAWLTFQLQTSQQPRPGLEQGAVQLATLIPQTAPGWPGSASTLWQHGIYPAIEQESAVLLAVVDRLLDAPKGAEEGVGLWNLLVDRRIISGDRWTAANPLLNSRFHFDLGSTGLNWRAGAGDTELVPDLNELAIRLDGNQPESVELLRQRVYLPARAAYRFVIESRTEDLADDQSLQWQVLDHAGQTMAGVAVHPSADWRRESAVVAAQADARVVEIVLTCRRPLGSVRAHGTVRFRLVSLELSH